MGRGEGGLGGITEHNLASVKSTSELLTKPGAPCYVANNMEVCGSFEFVRKVLTRMGGVAISGGGRGCVVDGVSFS